jgi:hypothetical protein
VNSTALRQEAQDLAETWMVQIATVPEVRQVLGSVAGDLNIEFTRLLTYAERRSPRRVYDVSIAAILRDLNARVIIPLKQAQGSVATSPPAIGHRVGFAQSAFVGHSFAAADQSLVSTILRILRAFNIRVETGERPGARSVSEKVKRRIERCDLFVGVFSRRDRLSGRDAYSTSPWVIDEKAYAVARDRKLVLLKDQLVESIGGIQSDYEYIEFDPDNVLELALRLVELLTGED